MDRDSCSGINLCLNRNFRPRCCYNNYKYGGDVFDVATIDENYWIYPLTKRDILTKVSLATEEIYFMHKENLHKTKA